MISILREFSKTWVFKALMVVLVGSFVGFGGKQSASFFASAFRNDNAAITAGSRTVTGADFKMQYDRLHQQYEQQGNNFTNQEFVDAGQHTIMLKKMTEDAAFSAWLDKMGVKPSAKLLVTKIAAIPQFLSSVTGRFDQESYQRALAGAGFTVDAFESQERDLIAQQQYRHATVAGLKPPRIYATIDTARNLQSRDTTVMTLTPESITIPADPTDAELTAYYTSLKDSISRPEIRAGSVVVFDPAQFAKDIPVSDEDLRKAYAAQHDTMVTPETRTFVQVTASDMGTARKISADLKSGQAPDAVAKKYKATVIPYSLQPKTAIADTKVGDAAFAMASGQVSDPIQGNLGIAVVKMGDIKAGSAQSFESVRERLSYDYRKDKAAGKVHDISTEFYNALQQGEDFDAIAKRLGLPIVPLPLLTADGKVIDPRTGQQAVDPRTGQGVDYAAYTPLVKAVFDLDKAGSASDVQSLGEGVYFAAKLNTVLPAGPPPLDQIRQDLIHNWKSEKIISALTAKADEARGRIAKGESVAAVAASFKAQTQTYRNLTPQMAQEQKLSRALVSRVFTLQANDVYVAQTGFTFQVGRVDAIHQGVPAEANQQAAMVQGQLGNMVAQDMFELSTQGTTKTIKPKSNVVVVLRQLNIDPTVENGGLKPGKQKAEKTPNAKTSDTNGEAGKAKS